MTAQEGQRHGVAAVVHLAGKLFRFQEGDVLRVRHHQLTVALACGHDELAEHGFGLLRCGDADGALLMTPAASAARRSTERLTPSGPTAVTAHTGIWGRASARPASGSSTTANAQPASPKQYAAAASSAASCGRAPPLPVPLRPGRADPRPPGHRPHGRGPTAAHNRHGTDRHGCRPHAGCCQQGRHGGLARRTGHAHELHLLRRSRQGRAQLVGGGKAVR